MRRRCRRPAGGLKCYSQPGALFYEALGIYTDTINLIRSHAMGAGVARALGAGRGVLLKNHGVVVTGATIDEAVIGVIMLENGAMVQLLAEAAGDPAPEFPREDIEQLKARHQPARAIQGQFRLSGAPGRASREIGVPAP